MMIKKQMSACLRFLLPFGLLVGSAMAVAQTCTDGIVPEKTARFTDQEDGTAYDTQAGLMWMRCPYGMAWDVSQCEGDIERISWADSLSTADQLEFAGYSDWRIPNINELQSLVDWHCYSPAINGTTFPDAVNAAYWSSTMRDSGDVIAPLAVDFYNGRVMTPVVTVGFVMFVRDTQ